jgi:hypothetical protein
LRVHDRLCIRLRYLPCTAGMRGSRPISHGQYEEVVGRRVYCLGPPADNGLYGLQGWVLCLLHDMMRVYSIKCLVWARDSLVSHLGVGGRSTWYPVCERLSRPLRHFPELLWALITEAKGGSVPLRKRPVAREGHRQSPGVAESTEATYSTSPLESTAWAPESPAVPPHGAHRASPDPSSACPP